jgi:hypothetical protein
MVAKPAVVGVAAAAVFATAAVAGPCVQRTVAADTATGLYAPASDKLLSASVDAPHSAMPTETVVTDGQAAGEPAAGDFASFNDISEPTTGAAANTGMFTSDGVKITRLQATITANTYVAGVVTFAPPVQQHFTDDVTLYTPDYLAVKGMSPTPKRPPSVVGVGLSTAPSQNSKTSDTAPKGGYLRQLPIEPDGR